MAMVMRSHLIHGPPFPDEVLIAWKCKRCGRWIQEAGPDEECEG